MGNSTSSHRNPVASPSHNPAGDRHLEQRTESMLVGRFQKGRGFSTSKTIMLRRFRVGIFTNMAAFVDTL